VNRDLRAEEERDADVRAYLEILVEEAAVVCVWAQTELGQLPRRRFLRRRFLESVRREMSGEVTRGRAQLRRAAP
jgi:hypothetical protein